MQICSTTVHIKPIVVHRVRPAQTDKRAQMCLLRSLERYEPVEQHVEVEVGWAAVALQQYGETLLDARRRSI